MNTPDESPDDTPDGKTETDGSTREVGDPRPSRTALTRAANEVNKLGLQICMLTPKDLDRLDLPERVREEVDVWQKLKARSRGRQNRLIGQLLRAEDHESIRKQVATISGGYREVIQREKLTEGWLNRIIEEGDPAVEALIAAYPAGDRQRLRRLTRSARQDPESSKGKRARRDLLRAIRSLRN